MLMKWHVSAYLAIIRLQSSKRLNIVCVWRMLRSHLAKKLYMRYKLRVSTLTRSLYLMYIIMVSEEVILFVLDT